MPWFHRPEKLPTDLASRAQSLHDELSNAVGHYRRIGQLNYYTSMILVGVAIGASAAVAIGGILFDASSKTLGMIALFPAIATLINTVYQPQPRSSWHYKKKDRINALRRRLKYELPVQPSADNVVAISSEWETIDDEMNVLWEKNFSINWTAVSTLRAPQMPPDETQKAPQLK